MIEKEITVVNKLGLHARAASKLVKLTAGFDSQIILVSSGQEVDAKSIMGILMLAATQGTTLSIRTEGSDEASAMEAVEKLFSEYFGEDE